MMDDKSQFITFESKDGVVTFGDNGKGCIMGIDNIHITPSTSIQNILLVDGLKITYLGLTNFMIKSLK